MNISNALPSAVRIAVAASLLSISSLAARADTLSEVAGRYNIQPSSRIAFSVGQVGGGGIAGTFRKFTGVFALNKADVGRSEITFTLYPESVSTGESRIESFLRSDAVFDSANYPTIS